MSAEVLKLTDSIKSWWLLRKLRRSTTRITSLVQAVVTLQLTCSEDSSVDDRHNCN
ncbi:hypothetical protein A8924_5328 [Saccharopolyspora erythraea NRRL 2338]|nr:hypothetical protein A8924_5328 [Saccharopolyspora erythraea NRRL 2338]